MVFPLLPARYRRAGARGPLASALVPAVNSRATLEMIVGPLSAFEVDRTILPTPAEIEALSDADKLALRARLSGPPAPAATAAADAEIEGIPVAAVLPPETQPDVPRANQPGLHPAIFLPAAVPLALMEVETILRLPTGERIEVRGLDGWCGVRVARIDDHYRCLSPSDPRIALQAASPCSSDLSEPLPAEVASL